MIMHNALCLPSSADVHDEMCTCSSRKTWSVEDLEKLLKAWGETLQQVGEG